MDYTLVDFSAAMHDLAIERLGELARNARFVCADFRKPDWMNGLRRFDAVVTMQAVHELRHKSMSNDQLYMTVSEQRECIEPAGYGNVRDLMRQRGLVLHRAAVPGQ